MQNRNWMRKKTAEQLKCRIIDYLLQIYPNIIIGNEIMFGSSRNSADLLAIIGNQIIAIEIKSKDDNLKRLVFSPTNGLWHPCKKRQTIVTTIARRPNSKIRNFIITSYIKTSYKSSRNYILTHPQAVPARTTMAKGFDAPPTLERSGSEHRVGRFPPSLLRFLSPGNGGTEGGVKTIEEGRGERWSLP